MKHTKYMKYAPSKLNDDDMDDYESQSETYCSFFQQTHTSVLTTLVIDEMVREPRYYRNFLQVADTASQDDEIVIKINTCGGYGASAVAIINAMHNTEASVVAVIDGEASSAGSIIALSAPVVVVMPYSTLMIHPATFGAHGSQANVVSNSCFTHNQAEKLLSDAYRDFLTDTEFKEMLIGREFRFGYDEIIERLNLRQKIRQDREDALEALESSKAKTKAVVSKPSPSAKKAPSKASK